MNWDALGAIGEIVGAAAVIVTLIYLAKQVKQSVGMARASQNRVLHGSYEGNCFGILAIAGATSGFQRKCLLTTAKLVRMSMNSTKMISKTS
jgi:hypothetical protein